MVIDSKLGFGTNSIMGAGSEDDRQKLFGVALEEGIAHFDTARYYGLGQAEAALGRFCQSRRDQVTITTKFGIVPESLVEAGVFSGRPQASSGRKSSR